MHGRVQPEGQSFRILRSGSSQHMRSALPLATTDDTVAVQGDHNSFPSSITTIASGDSFFKDGRKINVGDCALFKPPQDAPPFIGLIRWLAVSKDNNLQLGVNWLYRPAEIKLGKGTSLEGAPNEIFYSFHKDKIPAASLLHPCKVAFLPRGVGLPEGTSSFVCRRVYDIANKCLWWLTDQDYINERQEEVDQLLNKTKVEMHATLQAGGRSPKQANGPTSTSQLKPVSDSVQNTGSSLHSHVKGRKRERGDHSADPVKRERSLRSDDPGSLQCKSDSNIKSEISRITEKGGLTELEGVERLVQLMQPDRAEKKMDLASRSMLAGVVAATEKVDCLNRFVQLRGLPVLDEWLQDVHKRKIGDGNGLKESDKAIEEFILVSLRALDRLPININALQMCNIGKSVNHLRSHKNLEIQRKARSLVDTWKKRVEAEMNSIDAKSASTQGVSAWTSKSRLPDAAQSGSRTASGSDAAQKSSVTLNSASKTTSARSSHGECNIKSATASPAQVKTSSPSSGKESQPKTSAGTPDAPLIREDRSSSSNQSHNYSQSSGKEDGKGNVGAPVVGNKITGVTTRNRKNSGFSGTSISGSPKEISSSRSSPAQKNIALEKLSQSSLSNEKVLEGSTIEGVSNKLIVKIPNRVCSPTRGAVCGSLEDSTFMSSQVTSPALSDKHEQFDHTSEDKSDAHRCNVASEMKAESWQNSDPKDALTRSTDGAASPAVLPDEEQSMSTGDSRKSFDGLPTNQLKSRNLHESSFSPMNALVESCAKYSEANTMCIDDDVGMKLLASVATGEMSRSDLVSPTDSTEQSTHAVQDLCLSDEAKSKLSPNIAGFQIQFSSNATETDDRKQIGLDGGSWSEDESRLRKSTSREFRSDGKFTLAQASVEVHTGVGINHLDVRDKTELDWEIGEKSDEKIGTTSLTLPTPDLVRDDESIKEIQLKKETSSNACTEGIINCKPGAVDVMVTEEKVSSHLAVDEIKPIVEDVVPEQSSQIAHKKETAEGLGVRCSQQIFPFAITKSETTERADNGKLLQVNLENFGELNEKDAKNCLGKAGKLNTDMEVDRDAAGEIRDVCGSCSVANELKSHHNEASVENKVMLEHESSPEGVYPCSTEQGALQKKQSIGPKSSNIQTVDTHKTLSACIDASSSATMDADGKIKFDLNEGFGADEGKYGEPVKYLSSDATNAHKINSAAFCANSIPSGHASSVTVAAAAKGPFVPPEDLLRSRGALGWKGSAATSAFRPAEPRKVSESPLGSANMSSADASSKHVRIPLDIDLNVPDERVIEEMISRDSLNDASGSLSVRSSGGLDLDLNRVDEANENGSCSSSINHKGESSVMHVKPLGGMASGDIRRDFDLNDGPAVDDNVEPLSISQQIKSGLPAPVSSLGLRVNVPVQGSLSSWFTPGNTFSTIAIPSVLPDRGEHLFPVFPPSTAQRTFNTSGVTSFTPDIYPGSVLSSSPAIPFPPSHFQFPVYPFGTTFPLPSTTFPVGASSYLDSSSGPRLFAPPVHSQLMGPVGSVASQFPRSYMVGLRESSSNGLESSRKWGKQGLDLNSGPAAVESETREYSIANSRALAEEQSRMQSVTSGIMKRKEPDGGWENENFRFKQSSWQ